MQRWYTLSMQIIADLHLHSRFARAVSKNMTLPEISRFAKIKGIDLVATGDWTHPIWFSEITNELKETNEGIYQLKNSTPTDPKFILSVEISSIYKDKDKTRRIHYLILSPNLKTALMINQALAKRGVNLISDGRPITGLSAHDVAEIALTINEKCLIIPAHIWTPWFSLFGSKSGFDSLEECFSDLKSHIFAVETGLSSDPPMNWRIQDLDHVRLISNSDAHSPGYLGRNANVFNTELDYFHIRQALEENDLNTFLGTLDMYPHQGKYHYDGHRKCNISLNPAETIRLGGICPGCGRKMTLGVLNRVEELAARPEGYMPESRHGFKSIIPLADIFSEIFDVGPKSKKVVEAYRKTIESLGPELHILTGLSIEEIETARVPLLAEAVKRMREGSIRIEPGYDGEFGTVNIFSDEEKNSTLGKQATLF